MALVANGDVLALSVEWKGEELTSKASAQSCKNSAARHALHHGALGQGGLWLSRLGPPGPAKAVEQANVDERTESDAEDTHGHLLAHHGALGQGRTGKASTQRSHQFPGSLPGSQPGNPKPQHNSRRQAQGRDDDSEGNRVDPRVDPVEEHAGRKCTRRASHHRGETFTCGDSTRRLGQPAGASQSNKSLS